MVFRRGLWEKIVYRWDHEIQVYAWFFMTQNASQSLSSCRIERLK